MPPNDTDGIPSDTTTLLRRPDDERVKLEEYGAIAVSILRKDDEEPIVIHDFNGPCILDTDTLQRQGK